MSNFYTRYVPPPKKTAADGPLLNAEKRKQPAEIPQREKRSKRVKLSNLSDEAAEETRDSPSSNGKPRSEDLTRDSPKTIIDRYRVTETAKKGGSSIEIKTRRPQNRGRQDEKEEQNEEPELDDRENHKPESELNQEEEETDEWAHQKKHAAVISKLKKAKLREPESRQRPEGATEEPPIELHGLEPIPQPEPVDIVPEKPTYSTLPAWQEAPVNVPSNSSATFESLGIGGPLLDSLHKSHIDQAFPVQATVLPLLLEGPSRYDGDLCISAATGSGKTLAYVLPIIAALRNVVGTKLRAVIVVPTRELVKQVRDLCETCASGSSLTIGTAVGSKTLKDEQDMLVLEEKLYDMEQYQAQQQSKIDWSSFSLEKLMRQTKSEDPVASIGYITRYRSKVDLLITTPGRLVDHLKSTSGFTLNDVEWLVVDEADRLLNESYQEWIEVVTPALESHAATQSRDRLLRFMRMTPPRRKVTKILLSATMTRDLSKLNALGLNNPKLIVLGSSLKDKDLDAETVAESLSKKRPAADEGSDAFHLPEDLREFAIAVPDGSEKPLSLLELLRDRIGIHLDGQKAESLALTSPSGVDADSEMDSDSSSDTSSSGLSSSEEDSSSSSDSSSEEGPASKRDTSFENPIRVQEARKEPRALIFARSTASATRLSRLLALLCPSLADRISTLTRSTASSASSRRALSAFRNSKTSVLIATDRASRGLDVPGLEHVISYDVPSSALTYVHRVGRTARAGKEGHAWTFVEHREGAWFWREIGGRGRPASAGAGGNDPPIQRRAAIKRLTLGIEHKEMKQRYEEALRQLGEEARAS